MDGPNVELESMLIKCSSESMVLEIKLSLSLAWKVLSNHPRTSVHGAGAHYRGEDKSHLHKYCIRWLDTTVHWHCHERVNREVRASFPEPGTSQSTVSIYRSRPRGKASTTKTQAHCFATETTLERTIWRATERGSCQWATRIKVTMRMD